MNKEKVSVNRVNEAKLKQQNSSQEQRNLRETSEISRSVTKMEVRMSQSPSIRSFTRKAVTGQLRCL